MDEKIRKFLDYLVAAIDRAEARGWEAEAEALARLYQAVGALMLPQAGDHGRVELMLKRLARVNPRKARSIRPAFEGLISGLEFELCRKEAA